MTASYYENVWFFYTPVKVTVDPQINMDWGVGRITPTGANYISVRWCVPNPLPLHSCQPDPLCEHS